jgi:LysR family hydrogen peroxide-inducible transcriptional activator
MSDSVEFRHLEYLIAIDEGKNFTRAAERVYRSQPAVSHQIRTLEDDIGFPIFVRGGRDGVSPTPAGELVLGWARNVLAERREILVLARAIHKGEVPPLRLGFSSFVNPHLIAGVSQLLRRALPGVQDAPIWQRSRAYTATAQSRSFGLCNPAAPC